MTTSKVVPKKTGGPPTKGVRYGGRKPGTPNKATQEFRVTIQRLLDSNAENIAIWLAQVAEGIPATYDRKGNCISPGRPADPVAALARLGALADFAAPKLSRQEQVGDGGGPLTVIIRKET